jgi:diadenylate cyclase
MDFLIPTFTDILDILFITIILYSLFLVVKKSTAIEIISSVILLFILFTLAALFNLKMILGVLRGIQNYWVLIIVIIFQNEIKNILSQLSKSKNILSLFRNPIKVTYSTILNAVSVFSEKKIGALIVFEKNQKLDTFFSTGEILDAQLSPKLLLSIFNKSNLLHDGAVIIRNDRIYAAKVVLPLSENDEYARSLGTRHLAAIGITEISDAFCIVVSEYNSRISFAKDQKITLDVSIEELLQLLTDEAKK